MPYKHEGAELLKSYSNSYIFLNVGIITRRGRKAASNSCPFKELNYSL